MIKDKIHHSIIRNDMLYNNVKFSQSFPFKQVRKYYRNKYIKNNFRELKQEINQKPTGQVCIETTSICNTKCSFCPHKNMEREKVIMDDKVFLRTMLEIKTMHIKNIGMYYFGEPLTDPKLDVRINMMKKEYPCYIQVISNGLGLNGEWIHKLLNTDLDEILISLDATDKESYEKVRKGSYAKVIANILNLVLTKQRLGKNKPKIILRTMVTKDNKKQVKRFTDIWKNDVDEIQYGRLHNFSNTYVEAQQKHLINSPCLFLWSQLIILSNGDVIPCCIDYEGKLKLGNIMNRPLKKIWNGDAMQYLRRQHLEGNYPPLCKNCDMNDSLVARWWNYD